MRKTLLWLSLWGAGCGRQDKCDPENIDWVGSGGDENCDGIDGTDSDGDGHASALSGGADCDDNNEDIYPDASDVCNGLDDDCNGLADDGEGSSPWYRDSDGDGYGLTGDVIQACEAPAGYVAQPGDCDDVRSVVHPDRTEACNGYDDNCDDTIDGPGADGYTIWHLDADADGFGDPAITTEGCDGSAQYVLDGTDCDDGDDRIRPLAPESCNGLDDDCDLATDEDPVDAPSYLLDIDGDGFGDDTTATPSCSPMYGRVLTAGDCDDNDVTVHPSAPEICDLIDNDCDLLADDDDQNLSGPVWYYDYDGDEHGDPSIPLRACAPPAGYSASPLDCDDDNASVYTGAAEIPDNGVDEDCDGADPPDFDGDGAPTGLDCDDTDPNLSPTATDIVGDSIDQNCDGIDGTDIDLDGTASLASGGGDCDDFDPLTYAGATERLVDGIDNDCEGSVDSVDWEQATAVALGTRVPDRVGDAVAGADFDGDGAIELVAGAPERYRSSLSNNSRGHVYLWRTPLASETDESSAHAVITGPTINGNFGDWVGVLPDLDADGLPELATGDPRASSPIHSSSGALYVWLDLPSGAISASSADLVMTGDANARLSSIFTGEMTGDGEVDFLLPFGEEHDYGGAYMLAGPFAPGTVDLTLSATATFSTTVAYSHLSRATAADLDGDGVDDAALASKNFGNGSLSNVGRINIIEGPLSGSYPVDTAFDARITGDLSNGELGDVLRAADLDGDGLAEIVASSSQCASTNGYRGCVWVFVGPFAGSSTASAAVAFIEGAFGGQGFGSDLVLPGDLDEDGFGDMIVGAGYESRAYILRGPLAGSSRLGDLSYGVIAGEDSSDLGDIDTISLPGDIDGDGQRDLWLGAPNSSYGVSEAGIALLLPGAW